MKKIDLHMHSNLSDGLLTPEMLVQKAVASGCSLISITDHDFVQDYLELEQKYHIPIISGVEFNSSVTNMHLLGYGMQKLDKINYVMDKLKKYNEKVCYEVIEMMQKDGYDISKEQINDYLTSIGLKYDTLDKRKIVMYLMYKGYSNGILETYQTLIGVKQKYYIPNKKISPIDIIELIDSSGGIVVLAHPNTLNLSNDDLLIKLKRLMNYGLSGIEIINGKMNLTKIYEYDSIARKLGIIQTVGSDFHIPSDQLGIDVSEKLSEDFCKRLILK